MDDITTHSFIDYSTKNPFTTENPQTPHAAVVSAECRFNQPQAIDTALLIEQIGDRLERAIAGRPIVLSLAPTANDKLAESLSRLSSSLLDGLDGLGRLEGIDDEIDNLCDDTSRLSTVSYVGFIAGISGLIMGLLGLIF